MLLVSFAARAQEPERFYCRYGGSGEDVGYSAKQTKDGHYIIAGSSSSYGSHGNTDVYLLKLDKFGFPSWEKFYGGSGNEVGKSVIQLPDSGYMIAGYTDSYGAGGFDAFILRTDKDGVQLWQRTFGGTDWDFASDLVQAIDGNIFVVGNTYSFGNGKKDGFILKYDMSGNLLTQKFMGGAEDDELRSIIVTNDFQLATVGYTESRGEINGDGYFAKMDLNCDTIFTKTFGGPYKDYACDLVQKDASQGNCYFISGAKTFSINGKSNSYYYKTTPTGDFILDGNEFRNGNDENFVSVANSYFKPYLTGFVRSANFPGTNLQVDLFMAYTNGVFYLANASGGFGDEFPYSIEPTNDGGFVTVGSTTSYGSFGSDIYFIKQDSTFKNYSSVVGIEKNEKVISGVSINYWNNKVFVEIYDSEAEIIEILDIKGVVYKEIETTKKKFSIDLSEYPSSIFILSIRLKNGNSYRKKILTGN